MYFYILFLYIICSKINIAFLNLSCLKISNAENLCLFVTKSSTLTCTHWIAFQFSSKLRTLAGPFFMLVHSCQFQIQDLFHGRPGRPRTFWAKGLLKESEAVCLNWIVSQLQPYLVEPTPQYPEPTVYLRKSEMPTAESVFLESRRL